MKKTRVELVTRPCSTSQRVMDCRARTVGSSAADIWNSGSLKTSVSLLRVIDLRRESLLSTINNAFSRAPSAAMIFENNDKGSAYSFYRR